MKLLFIQRWVQSSTVVETIWIKVLANATVGAGAIGPLNWPEKAKSTEREHIFSEQSENNCKKSVSVSTSVFLFACARQSYRVLWPENTPHSEKLSDVRFGALSGPIYTPQYKGYIQTPAFHKTVR